MNEEPKVPQEVEEVIQDNTQVQQVYIPEEETKSKSGFVYIAIFALIVIAVVVSVVLFMNKKNPILEGITDANGIQELEVSAYKLGGYVINLPKKYTVSEQDGNRLLITNYNDKVQLSLEINPDLSVDIYNSNVLSIKEDFKAGYGLQELLFSQKDIDTRAWYILSSKDEEGFNYTFSFTGLEQSTVSVLTISQTSDYSNIYKELTRIINSVKKLPKEEEPEEEEEPSSEEGKKTTKKKNTKKNNTKENGSGEEEEEPEEEEEEPVVERTPGQEEQQPSGHEGESGGIKQDDGKGETTIEPAPEPDKGEEPVRNGNGGRRNNRKQDPEEEEEIIVEENLEGEERNNGITVPIIEREEL